MTRGRMTLPRLLRSAAAILGLGVILALAVPAVATADESACADTYFSTDGRELFQPERAYLPPPLLAFPADCASRVAGGTMPTANYDLLYVDIPFERFVAIMASFEAAGWGDGLITTIDYGPNDVDSAALTAEQLAAIDPPQFAHGRFGDLNTGNHIVSVTYTDGETYNNEVTIRVPSLLIELSITEPFGGTGIADPSVLSTLRTVSDAALTPTKGVVIAASAVFLMLVVGYPGALLGSVIGDRYDQFTAWLRQRVRKGKKADGPRRRMPTWLFWLGLAASAVVAGFVDPAFGLNPMSARVLVTAFLSLLVFNVVVWLLVRAVMRRVQPSSKPVIDFRWGSLLLLIGAVALARLLQFQPGVIFGMVAGLAFAVTLVASRKALVVLLGSGFALGAALLAWLAYSLVAPLAEVAPGNAVLVFGSEFLSALTIEGISSLPLALLPLLALDGAALFGWKKWVWALAYAGGLGAFMLVMLTVPDSWGGVSGDYLRWVLIFVVFAVISIGVWVLDLAATKRRKRPQPN